MNTSLFLLVCLHYSHAKYYYTVNNLEPLINVFPSCHLNFIFISPYNPHFIQIAPKVLFFWESFNRLNSLNPTISRDESEFAFINDTKNGTIFDQFSQQALQRQSKSICNVNFVFRTKYETGITEINFFRKVPTLTLSGATKTHGKSTVTR